MIAVSPGQTWPIMRSVVARKSASEPHQSVTKRPNSAWLNIVFTN